jgi:hypothetical protein
MNSLKITSYLPDDVNLPNLNLRIITPQDVYLTRVSDLSEIPYMPYYCWDHHASSAAYDLKVNHVVDMPSGQRDRGVALKASATMRVTYDNRVVRQDALTKQTVARVLADRTPEDSFFVVHLHDICAECNKMLDQPGMKYWVPSRHSGTHDDTDKISLSDPEIHMSDPNVPLSDTPFCLCDDCHFLNQSARLSGNASGIMSVPCAFEDMISTHTDIPELTEEDADDQVHCPVFADRLEFMSYCQRDSLLRFDTLENAKRATKRIVNRMHYEDLQCASCQRGITIATRFEGRDAQALCETCHNPKLSPNPNNNPNSSPSGGTTNNIDNTSHVARRMSHDAELANEVFVEDEVSEAKEDEECELDVRGGLLTLFFCGFNNHY